MSQLLFFILLAIVIGASYSLSKNRVRCLLGFAIFITPWQGGLWMDFLYTDILLSMILYIVVLGMLLSKPSGNQVKKKSFIIAPASGITVIAIISASMALNVNRAFFGVLMIIIDMIIFYCISKLVEKPSDLRFIFRALLGSLILQGILGIVQFKFIGFKVGVIDEMSWMPWRSNGTFAHPNHYGMFLVLTMPLILRLSLFAFKRKNKKLGYYYFIGFVLGAGGLVASQNRGSWIGLSSGLILVFLSDILIDQARVRKTFRRFIIPAIVVFIVFLLKYGDFFYNRLFKDDAEDMYSGRKELQAEAYPIIFQHQPFGVGWGNYEYYMSSETQIHGFVHNLYLLISAEWGFVGLTFFLLILIGWGKEIWIGIKNKNVYIRNVSLAILSSFIGLLIASLPGPDFFISYQTGANAWILMGIIVALNKLGKKFHMKRITVYFKKNEITNPDEQRALLKKVDSMWGNAI